MHFLISTGTDMTLCFSKRIIGGIRRYRWSLRLTPKHSSAWRMCGTKSYLRKRSASPNAATTLGMIVGRFFLNSSFRANDNYSHSKIVFLDIPVTSQVRCMSSNISVKYRLMCALTTLTRVASYTNISSRRLGSLVRITFSITGRTFGRYCTQPVSRT